MEDELIKEEVNELEKSEVEKPAEEKTYTEAELKAQLQSETDKRVSQALKTAQDKWEAEFKQKLEAEKSEAEKLGAMSAEERAMAEFKAEKEKFEEERKQHKRETLELQTVKELSSLGLPTEFSGYVLADSADEIQANISTFKGQWESAIENAVNDRLKGKTPKVETGKAPAMSKQEFGRLPAKEKSELMKTNPDLVNQLLG